MWDLTLLEGGNDRAPHSSAENSIHSSTMQMNWRMEYANRFDNDLSAWIVGPNRERLLWIPEDFARGLDPPGSTHVIRPKRRKLDFSRFVHGEDWVKCYQPQLEDEQGD